MTEFGEPVPGAPGAYTPSSIVPGRPGYNGGSGSPGGNGEAHPSTPAEPVDFLAPPPLL